MIFHNSKRNLLHNHKLLTFSLPPNPPTVLMQKILPCGRILHYSLFFLYLKYSECVKNRRYEDENDAYRCNVLYNYLKKSLLFELGIKLNLFDNCFRLNYITYKDAGKESNYRHKHAVAYEIEEVK